MATSNLPQPRRPQPPSAAPAAGSTGPSGALQPSTVVQAPTLPQTPISGSNQPSPRPANQSNQLGQGGQRPPQSQGSQPSQSPASNRSSQSGPPVQPPRPPQNQAPAQNQNRQPRPQNQPMQSSGQPPRPQAPRPPGGGNQPPRQQQPSSGQAPRPAAPAQSAPPAAARPSAPAPKQSQSPSPSGSRLLQNLQSVSDKPFQDPSSLSTPAPISAAPTSRSGRQQPVAAPTAPAVPSEAAGSQPPAALPAAPARKAATARVGLFGLSRKLLFAVGGIVTVLVLSVIGWQFWQSQSSSTATPTGTNTPATGRTTNLTYWGLWEPAEVMQPLIDQYQAKNPNVKITYVQQNSRQYRQRLQAAIRDGSGPDIFRFHNTWTPMIGTDLSPAPSSVATPEILRRDYYPVATTNLVSNNQVLGLPLMYDGLALLYNKNMLQAANALPPSDWQQVRELALRLTIRSGERLERGGIALGTAENIDHFSDILGLMLLQNSADIANPSTPNAFSALQFYTQFANTDKVWDNTMPNSIQAFASEQVAMIFVPSWRITEIQKLNPNLSFGVTRLPQIDGTSVAWSTYWVEGVSAQSRHKDEAWKFLAYLSEAEQLRTFQNQASSVRGYGELYPKVQMASELKQNPLLTPYLDDALIARSWAISDGTFDEGINDGLIQYYKDAVNMVNQGSTPERALQSILPGIQQVLSRYGLAQAPATTP